MKTNTISYVNIVIHKVWVFFFRKGHHSVVGNWVYKRFLPNLWGTAFVSSCQFYIKSSLQTHTRKHTHTVITVGGAEIFIQTCMQSTVRLAVFTLRHTARIEWSFSGQLCNDQKWITDAGQLSCCREEVCWCGRQMDRGKNPNWPVK